MQIQDDYSDLVESVYIKGMNANVENNCNLRCKCKGIFQS